MTCTVQYENYQKIWLFGITYSLDPWDTAFVLEVQHRTPRRISSTSTNITCTNATRANTEAFGAFSANLCARLPPRSRPPGNSQVRGPTRQQKPRACRPRRRRRHRPLHRPTTLPTLHRRLVWGRLSCADPWARSAICAPRARA